MSTHLHVRPRTLPRPPMSTELRARSGLGTGRPLDPATRLEMERSFGQDLSAVRIHTGDRADRAAHALGAQAYTFGSDIVASSHHAGLAASSDRSLLSHELAHVVQQRRGGTSPRCAHETAADAAAHAIAAGRSAGPQPGAAMAVQRRVEFRDVGRGQSRGMPRVPELIDRLNAISTALTFSVGVDGALEYTVIPGGTETEFDRQMKRFIDDTVVIPLRMTTREALQRPGDRGPFNQFINFDSYASGLVDIDDFLSVDDLDLRTSLVHVLRERQVTRDYARRMGSASLDLRQPRPLAEFRRSHQRGQQNELAILQDFFGDPNIRVIDWRQRIFRSARGDTIREVRVPTRVRNLNTDRWEVVIRRTGRRMTAEAYRDLLASERAAAAAAAAPAPIPSSGDGLSPP